MPSPELDRILLTTAAHHLRPLAPMIALADPLASVSARSRMLCAGLACLARACYAALGGSAKVDEVGEAAAMLSLLTKIDDQVIDDLEFHGGPLDRHRDRQALERKTRAYLAPTLASIRTGRPATSEPRCVLAATLGQRLRALTRDDARLGPLLDTVAFGWEVQVRAVRVLSSDPATVDRAEVEAVTADISGAWLLMVTMIGALPEDAARPLDAEELAGFYAWGLHIQSADALADLAKDSADGLVASRPGFVLAQTQPKLWRNAFTHAEFAPLYRGLVESKVDLALLPSGAEIDRITAQLGKLGAVPIWMRWIHGFLHWRWLINPMCPREPDEPALSQLFCDELGRRLGRAWAGGWSRWQDAMIHAEHAEQQGAQPCSVR